MAANFKKKKIVDDIRGWLEFHEDFFNAPYGILETEKEGSYGTYTTFTFGVAKMLDAELRVYSPKFLYYWDSRTPSITGKYTSVDDLIFKLGETYHLSV